MKKKIPKLSTAILKGIEKYPNQATQGIWLIPDEDSACAIGGALYSYGLRPSQLPEVWLESMETFTHEFNCDIYLCNDGFDPDNICNEPIPRDVIAGMLKAINL